MTNDFLKAAQIFIQGNHISFGQKGPKRVKHLISQNTNFKGSLNKEMIDTTRNNSKTWSRKCYVLLCLKMYGCRDIDT